MTKTHRHKSFPESERSQGIIGGIQDGEGHLRCCHRLTVLIKQRLHK
jgi:hypothetical protein